MVTAADILAVAGFKEGYYTLSFPAFGAEKRGTPVNSYLRISDKPVVLRDEVHNPDYVVVMDPTVIHEVRVNAGLKEGGMIIANYPSVEALMKLVGVKNVKALNATKLAMEYLGRPITNTAMVGAFAGATKLVKLETLKETVEEWFKEKAELAERNVKLVEVAYKIMERG